MLAIAQLHPKPAKAYTTQLTSKSLFVFYTEKTGMLKQQYLNTLARSHQSVRAHKVQHGAVCAVVSATGQGEGRSRNSLFRQTGELYAKVEPFQPTLAAFMSK